MAKNTFLKYSLFLIWLVSSMSCFEAPVENLGPLLEVSNPINAGQSPKGIRKRKVFTLKNVGDAKLTITDFIIIPDDGTFTVQISTLPIVLQRDRQKDIPLTFLPTQEGTLERTLTLNYESQYAQPSPLTLKGKGLSNLFCLPCNPPPEPECGFDGESSIYYESTTATNCESDEGLCSYLMFENLCEDDFCNNETGRCSDARSPSQDSGLAASYPDSGNNSSIYDSGTIIPLFDSGNTIRLSDSGYHNVATDASTTDPCSEILCEQNAVCINATCQCIEGYDTFDGGFECLKVCDENGCSDGSLCTLDDICDEQGECVGTPVVCDAPPNVQCYGLVGSCNPSNGECDYTPVNGGCEDGDLCSLSDQCNNGVCTPGTTKICDSPDEPQCQEALGDCEATTGNCSYAPKGGGCDDGDLCTINDQCIDGACVAVTSIACNTPPADIQCHSPIGTCNSATGICTYATINGACNDGDLCTLNDQCNNGSCVALASKACNTPPADIQCHNPVGTCNSATGACSYAQINGGCDDGDPCTINDQCNNGTCAGVPMTCNNSGNICKSNDGSCVDGNCVYPNLDGVSCDDQNTCTQTDTCLGGTCVGSDTIPCNEHDGDPCFGTGICDSNSGECEYPINVGDECDSDNECLLNTLCLNDGSCGGGSPVTCSGVLQPENPCLEVRSVCDPVEGCYQNKPAAADNCCDGEGGHQGGLGPNSVCLGGCSRYDEETGQWVPHFECCCTPNGNCVDSGGETNGTPNFEICGFGGN